MIDLDQQIRGYYEAIIDPVDVEQLEVPSPASMQRPVPWWRGPVVAVAAAVAVVVAISAAVLVLRGGPDTVVEPTTETVAPTPETAVSGLSFEWTRVTLPGMPSKESMPSDESTVAVFDGGLVVAAHNHVWMSPDGVNWTMTNTFPANGEVRDLFAGGPGLVAVGAGSAAGSGLLRIWTSTDGITWTAADLDRPTGGGLRAVTGRGTDLVAVGYSLVATSSDGVTWTGTSPGGVWMHDVTVGGPGFVAVGGSENDGWSAAWTSQDGITWSKQPFGPTSGSWLMTEMTAITTGGPGFVAVGHGPLPGNVGVWPGGVAWVWTSPDGFTWTRAPHIPDLSIAAGLRDVATYGDTLVAVGSGTEGAAAVFTSNDGITWQQLPHDDLFNPWAMTSVVQYGDKLVAAGGDSVWIGTPQPSETVPDTPTTTAAIEPTTETIAQTRSTVAPTPETTMPSAISALRFRVDELDGEWWPGSDVAALPGGGFVVVTDGNGVFWTEDGEVWADADPDRMVSAHFQFSDYSEGMSQQPQRLTVVGDRIAVLDREAAQVWIGHLTHGEWESIPLGDAGKSAGKMALTSNDDLVFIVSDTGVSWVIDPEEGTVSEGSLPQSSQDSSLAPAAAWFGDRWVAVRYPGESLVSRDTMEWQRGTLYVDPDDPIRVTSLAVGNDAIIATGCRGMGPHPVIHSIDGVSWQWAPRFQDNREGGFWNTLHAGAAYSDTLGFVTVIDGGANSDNPFLATSRDGQAWTIADVTLPGGYSEIVNIAASADQVLLTVIDWPGEPTGRALLLSLDS